MQHCPQCFAEYREGFVECSDCRVPLVSGPPPEATEAPDPNLELAPAFECYDPVTLAWAESMLREAGIPFFHRTEAVECGAGLGYATPFTRAQRCLLVPRDRAPEARELLESAAEVADGPPEETSGA